MLYTRCARMCNKRQLSVCVPTTPGDDGGGCGQVLLTVTDDCRLLFTLSVQLCVQRNGRLGVSASRDPSVLADTCHDMISLLWDNMAHNRRSTLLSSRCITPMELTAN